MSNQIVECIPNFSEGRRLEVVSAIIEVITQVDGVTLLDHSSDSDHNRTVVTYVGPPKAVEEAAYRGIAIAAELINLNKHTGEHPRLGATDVVPFVPISGVSMLDCVEIARRLARRVGDELKIPVYLYEEAATMPERKNLAKVRKGEYELLKKEIGSKPLRKPDFGPSKLGPAGATVIGARPPLIAYNVYLNTEDVSIAKKIAKAVRHSSGGLHFVKGAGFLVDGLAQVSMNLTNYRKTPIFRVVEMIRREAARYGTLIEKSELIGLMPQSALFDSAAWYLQLNDFEQDQVLEVRMQSQQSEGETGSKLETTFLDGLAAGTPTPGGGSAAANAGAMAAGLVAMVARLTVGKKKYKHVEEHMWAVIEKAEKLRADLTGAVERDSAAFGGVMTAFKLPKGNDAEMAVRDEAIEQATLHATKVPLDVAAKSVEVLELASQVAEEGNTNAITDAGSAAALARASLSGAGLNVRINLKSLNDKAKVRRISKEIKTLDKQAAKFEKKMRAALSERGGLTL
ncbi:MAG: glutamate formimidoyltransferase [Chloroflexi bacterium]|nr:glutamate formimidoyltransferase [Chloroflexota bacterium]